MEKNDFTLYKKNGKIYSIGMEFNNLIRNADLPAMIGGGKKNRESHLTALGLPVGLALMDNKIDNSSIHDIHGRNFEGGVIKEDIYSKDVDFMANVIIAATNRMKEFTKV